MHRYHNPHLQGLFANKYQENGFGYVHPRGDLRDCIVPPDFWWLPQLATKALHTLSWEDTTSHTSRIQARILRRPHTQALSGLGLTSDQAWWPTTRWPTSGLAYGSGIVTSTGIWSRIQLWHAYVPGLTCYIWCWMWRHPEKTSRLCIPPNYLCRCHETHAEGGWKKAVRGRRITIPGRKEGRPGLYDVNNTLAAQCDTVWNCRLDDRRRTLTHRLTWTFINIIRGYQTFFCVHCCTPYSECYTTCFS